MLIKDFYKVIESAKADEKIEVKIQLNPDHEVYEGHFPNQPIVPGVIQLQIIKEIIENTIRKTLLMSNLIQVKYLTPIIPDEKQLISIQISQVAITECTYKFTVLIESHEHVYTKAKVEFAEV